LSSDWNGSVGANQEADDDTMYWEGLEEDIEDRGVEDDIELTRADGALKKTGRAAVLRHKRLLNIVSLPN
jgi:hypothetical protein